MNIVAMFAEKHLKSCKNFPIHLFSNAFSVQEKYLKLFLHALFI